MSPLLATSISPMTTRAQFVEDLLTAARQAGFTISTNRRNGEPEIDFGMKRIRAGQVGELWPAVVAPGADVGALIDKVAPGRPSIHEPMRKLIAQLRMERRL